MKRIDLVPPLVGIGGGLVDGTLQTFAPHALGGYVPDIFRAGLVIGGAAGWAMSSKPGDVSYTLMATGLYGLSARVVPKVDTLVKSPASSGSRIAGAAGCTTCGDRVAARPLIAQPALVTNPPGGSRESIPGIL
jgi:hypothetical protein